jgi:hypothetical protein
MLPCFFSNKVVSFCFIILFLFSFIWPSEANEAAFSKDLESASCIPSSFAFPDSKPKESLRGDVFHHPVNPGFLPESGICRVYDDFYLVCSSFESFPRGSIHHSKDLVNWELVNYCLADSRFFTLGTCPSSSGIYASVIYLYNGLLYLITTNYGDNGGFYVTAKDPRGPWWKPLWPNCMDAFPPFLFDYAKDETCKVILNLTEPHQKSILYEVNAPNGDVGFSEVSRKKEYRFIWEVEYGVAVQAGAIPAEKFSVEALWNNGGIMCFAGMMPSIHSSGNGVDCTVPVDFDWFDYQSL